MKVNIVCTALTIWALAAITSHASAQGTPKPRYLAAIQAELTALEVPHACERVTDSQARCAWEHRGIQSQRTYNVHLVYSDDNDTAYFYIARYLSLETDSAHVEATLRRLMELNWQLVVGKLEWNPSTGEVRMAMTMNTDSNFDRRAFRSIVRQLGPLADRHHAELAHLAER